MSQTALQPTKTEPETTPGPVNKGKNPAKPPNAPSGEGGSGGLPPPPSGGGGGGDNNPIGGGGGDSGPIGGGGGDDDVTDRLTGINAFLNYLTLNGSRYPSQSEKVALFLGFMQGPIAGKWATRRIEEKVNNMDNEDIPSVEKCWRTLQSLRAQFMQDFGPLDPKGSAQLKIDNLSMTGDLAKLDDYITAFDEWSGATEYNDAALITFFKKGLPKALTERVDTAAAVAGSTFDTLDKYKEVAIRLQNAYLRSKEERAAHKKVTATTTTTTIASVPVQGASTNAVQPANNGQAYTTPLKKLTPEERQHCMDNNLCFKCRLPGHQTFECPTSAPATSTATTTRQFSSNNPFHPAVRSTTTDCNNSSSSAPASSSSSPSSTVPPPDFTALLSRNPEDAIQAFFAQKDF
ncbi:hypothetical protein V5O48_018266 [Marasmius crinis-equi]|uniref:CCHC-type domain-containing protein n=1 Tax=Marasmius crinis-equi TaxID=585013 RepID=A0ABR3ELN2_9AGAR